jgi:hypothetical protein
MLSRCTLRKAQNSQAAASGITRHVQRIAGLQQRLRGLHLLHHRVQVVVELGDGGLLGTQAGPATDEKPSHTTPHVMFRGQTA